MAETVTDRDRVYRHVFWWKIVQQLIATYFYSNAFGLLTHPVLLTDNGDCRIFWWNQTKAFKFNFQRFFWVIPSSLHWIEW